MQIPSCDEQKQIPPLSLRLRSGSGRDDDAGFGGTTVAQLPVFQIDALEQKQGMSQVSKICDVGFFLRKKPDGSCGLK
jgi:hypothetical protein